LIIFAIEEFPSLFSHSKIMLLNISFHQDTTKCSFYSPFSSYRRYRYILFTYAFFLAFLHLFLFPYVKQNAVVALYFLAQPPSHLR